MGEQFLGLQTLLPLRVFGHCLLAASPLSGVFGFPLLAATNQLPALDPSRRGEGETGLKRGQRRDTRKKLLEGSCRSVLARLEGLGEAGIAELQKAAYRPAR